MRNRATRRSRRFHWPILDWKGNQEQATLHGTTLTDTGKREILDSMLFALLIVGGFILLVGLAVYFFWKQRSDEFWEDRG